MSTIPILIQERHGIGRTHEPVTFGIPIPKGLLKDPRLMRLTAGQDGSIPLQTEVLAHWPDGSIKWMLLDFQVSLSAGEQVQYSLKCGVEGKKINTGIGVNWGDCLRIDTGQAVFHIDTKWFRPFIRVVVGKRDVLESSSVVLKDDQSREFEPEIRNLAVETEGPIRTTVLMEGALSSGKGDGPLNFVARLHFFAGKTTVKVDFTLHNPRAARHPGGLWDLGDPGSFFFRDLSFSLVLKGAGQERSCRYRLEEGDDPERVESCTIGRTEGPLKLYQDSSGGENWHSRNHVNKDGQITTAFRGFKLFDGEREVAVGNRPWPEMTVRTEKGISVGTIRYFWQNFPNRLMADENRLVLSPFPDDARYPYELQGGEQKTHEMFLTFGDSAHSLKRLDWIHSPLTPTASPEWYAGSGAIPYLTEIDDENPPPLFDLVQTAVKGDNTFFHRREIIDEYGWRNFGDLYADHEAVGHNGPEPLISHYNNQYDCIYGMLMQYMATGNPDWFLLADHLAVHVKDIDIYHTDEDRPEYNGGLFWHTDHYIDAGTGTHRCFSKKHMPYRNPSAYGGGPSPSHNYSSGCLFHYYLTGDLSSVEAVKELASFVLSNIDMENTVSNKAIKSLRSLKESLNIWRRGHGFVQLHKVYGLDGPGRGSGNAINTALDAYALTKQEAYLRRAEKLIRHCIHPDDDIARRELLDIENKWMYIIFLQSLCKHLNMKTEREQFDEMWFYARESLLSYARWIAENEHPYLDKPQKLEHPNETWAAQEMRKCNVLLNAAVYAEAPLKQSLLKKADFFYEECWRRLLGFETRTLTRPTALMLQNGMMHSYCMKNAEDSGLEKKLSIQGANEKHYFTVGPLQAVISFTDRFRTFSLKREIVFLKWRLTSHS